MYKILRLFYCPHKYVKIQTYKKTYGLSFSSLIIVSQCRYCGKFKTLEID